MLENLFFRWKTKNRYFVLSSILADRDLRRFVQIASYSRRNSRRRASFSRPQRHFDFSLANWSQTKVHFAGASYARPRVRINPFFSFKLLYVQKWDHIASMSSRIRRAHFRLQKRPRQHLGRFNFEADSAFGSSQRRNYRLESMLDYRRHFRRFFSANFSLFNQRRSTW